MTVMHHCRGSAFLLVSAAALGLAIAPLRVTVSPPGIAHVAAAAAESIEGRASGRADGRFNAPLPGSHVDIGRIGSSASRPAAKLPVPPPRRAAVRHMDSGIDSGVVAEASSAFGVGPRAKLGSFETQGMYVPNLGTFSADFERDVGARDNFGGGGDRDAWQ